MIKLENNNKNTIIFFKNLFDTMIPERKDKKFPKLSDVIHVRKLLKVIFLNKNLKNKLKEKLNLIFENYTQEENLNYSILGKKVAESKEIENLIAHYILEAYFTSILIKKKLSQETNVLLSRNKIKRSNISSLLKKIKNSRIGYKKI